METNDVTRRKALASASAIFTTSLFTGRVKGANDRVTIGHIGLGAMGSGNLGFAMQVPEAQPVALCDVYQPALERAEARTKEKGFQPKIVKDFRDIIADKSIDAVCISTPDHWHAYMTIEACKAGKDVYVEKPACVYIEEGQKMVQAARKYNRVVQAGTMQRSGGYFLKAKELVKSGILGDITFLHAFQSGSTNQHRFGSPADGPVPTDLDWDMWLGPAPKVAFNLNRWGVKDKAHPDYGSGFPTFRYFWDYAGGAMTDWGVHLIDPMHQCLDEIMPLSISAQGDKFYVDDNAETPDTMLATFRYPKWLMSYESRTCNPLPLFGLGQGAGTTIHGTEGTIFVNRSKCMFIPAGNKVEAQTFENNREMAQTNLPHWKNWIACIKSREKPTSEIETCVRSSSVCLLGNLAMRHKAFLNWDETNWTVKEEHIRPFLKAKYRAPWKLEV